MPMTVHRLEEQPASSKGALEFDQHFVFLVDNGVGDHVVDGILGVQEQAAHRHRQGLAGLGGCGEPAGDGCRTGRARSLGRW